MTRPRLTSVLIATTFAALMGAHPTAASQAQTPAPGAREGDRDMTCADVARERQEIVAAVESAASRRRQSGALGRGLMGFARNVAGAAAPAVIGGMGGGSYVGAVAAQAAGQATGQAINNIPTDAPAQAAAAQPTAEQQARLDRLDRIGAYRQCPA